MKIKLNVKPDIPNANGHIYPKETIDKAIKEYLKSKVKYGTSEYTGTTLQLSRVAFNINDIKEEDGFYKAEIEILNTPDGKILEEQIRNNDFMLCHMGMGDVNEEGMIKDDFQILYYAIIPKERCA